MSGKKSIDFRKVFCVVFLFAVLISFAVPVMADGEEDGSSTNGGGNGEEKTFVGVNGLITEPEWLVNVLKFFGFGTTWADLIVSIAVLAMIFAAAFDVLTFTAFETKWVKYVIATAIALVASVSGGTKAVAAFFMRVAAGSVAFATGIAIIVAILFFVVGGFIKGKVKSKQYKLKADEARGLLALANEGTLAKVKEGKQMSKELGTRTEI